MNVTLKEMLQYCFGGAVVCLVQDEHEDKEPRRLVLLYLPDGQKMTVGVLRELANKDVVSLGATGLAEDPAWKQRVGINLLAPARLLERAAAAVRTGALLGESWIGTVEFENDREYAIWERDDRDDIEASV